MDEDDDRDRDDDDRRCPCRGRVLQLRDGAPLRLPGAAESPGGRADAEPGELIANTDKVLSPLEDLIRSSR